MCSLHACLVYVQASLAASNGAGGGPKKRLGDAVGWFKGLGQAATSMVGSGGGRAADAAEDPEYIKVGLAFLFVGAISRSSGLSTHVFNTRGSA
jgi:hypothetical protein